MNILDYIDEDTIIDMLNQHDHYRMGPHASIGFRADTDAWYVYWDGREVATGMDGADDVKRFRNIGEAVCYALSPRNVERWEEKSN